MQICCTLQVNSTVSLNNTFYPASNFEMNTIHTIEELKSDHTCILRYGPDFGKQGSVKITTNRTTPGQVKIEAVMDEFHIDHKVSLYSNTTSTAFSSILARISQQIMGLKRMPFCVMVKINIFIGIQVTF